MCLGRGLDVVAALEPGSPELSRADVLILSERESGGADAGLECQAVHTVGNDSTGRLGDDGVGIPGSQRPVLVEHQVLGQVVAEFLALVFLEDGELVEDV